MKFFFKCISVFVGLTILLTIAGQLVLDLAMPLSAITMFSAFISLLLTLLYGWIDAVYIQQRQPELEDTESDIGI
jgi:hypothetical protein